MDNIFTLVEASRYIGTARLLLDKLARLSAEQGYCNAGVNYLAKACGVSERNIQYCLNRLKADGVLEIAYRAGSRLQNHYRINAEKLAEGGAKVVKGGEAVFTTSTVQVVKRSSPCGETGFRGVVKPASPNLSLSGTYQSDSLAVVADPSYLPEHLQKVKTLVDQFNDLPSVHKMHFQKREWKGEYSQGSPFQKLVKFTENSDWTQQWEQFKEEYKNSSFLQKGGQLGNLNHSSWLLKPENFAKVISGQYRDKKPGLETFQDPRNYSQDGKFTVDLSGDDEILRQYGWKQ